MKKILLISLLAGWSLGLAAQSVDKAKGFLKSNELDKAKDAIDQTLTNPRNQKSGEAWYYKAKIYSALAGSDQFKTLVPDARAEAFEAVKKAVELDKNASTILLTVDNFKPVYDLYGGYFDVGANQYNAEKYEDALGNFKRAGAVGEYIFNSGWGLSKLDTVLTYYTALAAMNAKKDDEAVAGFQKLADAKVSGKPEYVTSYRYLAKYYLDKKDEANMEKYVKMGKELYPKDEYLPLVEFDFLRAKGDKKAIYAKYEELLHDNPTYELALDYANELFAETHTVEAKDRPADFAQRCEKIEGLYKKALELNPDGTEAHLNLGKHYFNQALILDDEASKIKGVKPEDVKRKADINSDVVTLSDKAIPHFEEVFNKYDGKDKLKVGERSEYKSACYNLMYCYGKKKMKDKVAFYQKKYDDVEANK
jgi:tetratricopeptide (TPR) repeat protein